MFERGGDEMATTLRAAQLKLQLNSGLKLYDEASASFDTVVAHFWLCFCGHTSVPGVPHRKKKFKKTVKNSVSAKPLSTFEH